MSLTIERAVAATRQMHDLIGEPNDVLGVAYDAYQRNGLSIEQIFKPNVRFFLARFKKSRIGCGGVALFDDYAEGQAYVLPGHSHVVDGWQRLCGVRSRIRLIEEQVHLAARNWYPPAGSDRSLRTRGVSATR
jgi:hypothetical protein